MTEQGKKKRF